RGAGYAALARCIERELRKRNSNSGASAGMEFRKRNSERKQFAQARIEGTRASAVAGAGSKGRCITLAPV
ncbi:hypothetical protein ABZ656_33460, partial [Streptomyces sp. NPDC007095]|uniref:hypothetical protein n=1 Tax=Streptomyces sp. NPDC007095 TaxID=3154482 RepID=UPI00340E9A5E